MTTTTTASPDPAACGPDQGPAANTAVHAAEGATAASAGLTEPASGLTAPPAVSVLYEDDHLLAVDKPAGLVTHPTYKHPNGTLTDVIFARQAARGEGRPWLLHRLDRETSGVVLFAKTEVARRAVVRQFERRTVRKQYLAITAGVPPQRQALIEAALARDPADRRRTIVVAPEQGQPATTRYTVLATATAPAPATAAAAGSPLAGQGEGDRGGEHPVPALILVEPLTGRTHQIRAHLAAVGAPLAGDTRYLPKAVVVADAIRPAEPAGIRPPRTLLHAWRLTITFPTSGEPLTLVAPIPADLRATAVALGLGAALDTLATLDTPPNPLTPISHPSRPFASCAFPAPSPATPATPATPTST